MTVVLLVWYNFLTGGAPSVTRSVVMAIVFLVGRECELKTDMLNTLAVSAVIILLIDARQLFQPGFQLSYAAVTSLVCLYPRLYGLRDYFPDLLARNFLFKTLFASLAVSFAAGLGTLPFTAIYFEKISLIGFMANIFIVPLSNVILGLGMTTVALSYINSWIALNFAASVSACTSVMLFLVDWFGSLRFAYIESHMNTAATVIYYYAIMALMQWNRRTFRVWHVIGLLLISNVVLYRSLIFGSEPGLNVTFFDVGQGDAALLEFPDGKVILVDGGPLSGGIDAGARTIVPYLKRRGLTSLSAIVLSHPHADHLGGLASVMSYLRPGRVFDAGSVASGSLVEEYEHILDSLEIRHDIVNAGMTLRADPSVRVQCLYPLLNGVQTDSTSHPNLNNESVVLKIIFGHSTLLLVGDAEEKAEEQLMSLYGRYLKSDVLKAGHHGSRTSSSAGFVDLVRPDMAVISVGVRNRFHHPSAAVIRRFELSGTIVRRTDTSGAIVLSSDGESWREIRWREE